MQQLTVVGIFVVCFGIQQGFSEGILLGHPKDASISNHAVNPWSYFKDLLDKHHKIRQFLCSRCLDIVRRIDQSIETEELKKDAEKLCAIVIKKEELARYCRIVVEGTLSTIYEQLRKFEIKPEVCSHLHLCDTCQVSLSSDAVDTFVGKNTSINPAVLLVNISELKTFLTQMATGGQLNDN
uniref:Saposin B-type domain-containing protein n=1 Tax=Haemonchus contortus TaxID=6289 RepID=A0A7I4Y2K2_HAECO|nr:Saposin type B domain containing protein [Haemonchus contortus]